MDTLLTDIETFCQSHGMSHSRFGELAMNDKPFVGQIAKGRRVWPETEEKVRAFMASYPATVESRVA